MLDLPIDVFIFSEQGQRHLAGSAYSTLKVASAGLDP